MFWSWINTVQAIQSINATAGNPALNLVCKDVHLAVKESYTADKMRYLINNFKQRFKDRMSDRLVQKRLIDHLLGFRILNVDILRRVESLYNTIQLECKSLTKTVIKYSNYDVVKWLINIYNVDVNCMGGYPIIKAISIKDRTMTDILLSTNKVDLSISGYKPIQYLILNGDLERLKELTNDVTHTKKKKLKRGSKLTLTSEMLYWSTKFKQWDIVDWMVEEKGVVANIKTIQLLS